MSNLSHENIILLDKLKTKIEALQSKRINILNSLKNRDSISFDEIVSKGREIDVLQNKIFAIEEAIHG